MKKINSILLVLGICFLLISCSKDENVTDTDSNTDTSNTPNILFIIADDLGKELE